MAADKPFNQQYENKRERPRSDDWNRGQSQVSLTLRELMRWILGARASSSGDTFADASGFLGDSMKVRAMSPSAMQIRLAAGLGFQVATGMTDVVDADHDDYTGGVANIPGLSDLSTMKPLVLSAQQAITIAPAPMAPNSRIDLIEVKYTRRVEEALTRDIGDPSSRVFSPTTVEKLLAYYSDGKIGQVSDPNPSTTAIGYVVGQEGNPPTAPVGTSGYLRVAEIDVGSGVVLVDQKNIRDYRRIYSPYGILRVEGRLAIDKASGNISLSNLLAPPGVQVSALPWPAAPASGCGVRLFLFAGSNVNTLGNMRESLRLTPWGTNSGTAATFVNLVQSSVGLLGATDAGNLQSGGGGIITPTLQVAKNQPVAEWDFFFNTYSGGSLAATNNPATVTCDFSIALQT